MYASPSIEVAAASHCSSTFETSPPIDERWIGDNEGGSSSCSLTVRPSLRTQALKKSLRSLSSFSRASKTDGFIPLALLLRFAEANLHRSAYCGQSEALALTLDEAPSGQHGPLRPSGRSPPRRPGQGRHRVCLSMWQELQRHGLPFFPHRRRHCPH